MNNILDINYEKYKLPNGLEVILHKNNNVPLVSVNIWYRVGSANERNGKTGFAHLFEHMMFQGSLNVEKEMHFKYIQEAGGSLNGSTSIDRTNYYETLPANILDLALWLESDRMGFMLEGLTQAKLDNQKDVVMNERRQRYENQPYGLSWEIMFSNLFDESFPYHWPTIGWMDDIKQFNLEDIKEFFKKYYAPNNASLVIAGDFDTSEVKEKTDKYFSGISSFESVPAVTAKPIPLNESKKIIRHENVQLPRLYMAWHSDSIFGKDDAVLDMLSEILGSSKNSRLHKSLVHEKQVAQDVSCFQYSAKLTGMFFIIVTGKPDSDLTELRNIVDQEIDNLIKQGVTEEEIIRTKNGIKSSFIYSLQNIERMANQINSYNFYINEPNSFIFDLNRYKDIDSAVLVESAKKYLIKPRVELQILPKNNQ